MLYKNPSTSGNALFIILIAIGLFALLGAAVMDSEGGGKTTKGEKFGLYANDLLLYVKTVEQAVQKMQARGVSESDLCFDIDEYPGGNTDYEYASCATVGNRVFHPQGGGVSYIKPHSKYLDSAQSALTYYGDYLITGRTKIAKVPPPPTAGQSELLIYLPYVKKELCMEINDMVGVKNYQGDAPLDNVQAIESSGFYFTGSFSSGRTIGEDGSMPADILSNKPHGCIKHEGWPGPNNYGFYYTLIVR